MKRIAEAGVEHHIDKTNNTWKVIHNFICKMLNISKRHELWFLFARKPFRFSLQEFYAVTCLKCEEDKNTNFEAWREDKGFWSTFLKRNGNVDTKTIRLKHLKDCKNWLRVDMVRLVYLSVIYGFAMTKDEKINIPHAYIRLVIYHGFYSLSSMSLFRVFTGSGTFWRNMVILESSEVQNCTDASNV
uniref:DUF1985 domain-containing protein n=1 Tax=Brassica oleracea var. oleracea TaxID=109376 RepID=A0A0D3D4E1_BRAOL